jgi:putative transposase
VNIQPLYDSQVRHFMGKVTAGCCIWSPVSYSYCQIGAQKRQEQTVKTYGNRVSILGIWQPGTQFEYALVQSGFTSSSYIQVMNWLANKAAATLASTGKVTVIVQDNGSIHTSKISRAQFQRWEQQGLTIFFLPPYCSEMNPIEGEWHQLKTHEIAGRMFDNEYDLAVTIKAGIQARSERGNYKVERFIFNST